MTQLSRSQASLLMQLHMGHIPLNYHLHRINKAPTPYWEKCGNLMNETVKHILFHCPKYRKERHAMERQLRRQAGSLQSLLLDKECINTTLKFIQNTGHLKQPKQQLNNTPT